MGWSPLLVSAVESDGRRSYRLGHELVDEFLEFASGRAPAEHGAGLRARSEGVLQRRRQGPGRGDAGGCVGVRIAQQRGSSWRENVVRISDGESGLSACDDRAPPGGGVGLVRLSGRPRRRRCDVEPGAAWVADARQPASRSARRAVGRVPCAVCRRSSSRARSTRCWRALRTARDRAMVEAMLLGGLRRCEVLGLRLEDLRLGERRVFIADGKGGHQRLVPIVADRSSPPSPTTSTRNARRRGDGPGVRGVEGTAPRAAVVGRRARRDRRRRPGTGRAGARDVSRAAPHLPDPAARGGHGARSGPGPGRSPLDRVDPDLPASRRRLARRRVPAGRRSDRRRQAD